MTQTTAVSKIIFPGNLVVGAAQAVEFWQVSNTIAGASDTSCDLTFTLKNEYASVPAICGTPLLTPGEGSSTTAITDWYIKSQSTSAIVITVNVDAAAGADKSNTITMCAAIIGPQA